MFVISVEEVEASCWLDAGAIYLIADNNCVCPVSCVPKKVALEDGEFAWTTGS